MILDLESRRLFLSSGFRSGTVHRRGRAALQPGLHIPEWKIEAPANELRIVASRDGVWYQLQHRGKPVDGMPLGGRIGEIDALGDFCDEKFRVGPRRVDNAIPEFWRRANELVRIFTDRHFRDGDFCIDSPCDAEGGAR